jgi:drug/metabolite transporter (DMT)-like permease
MVNNHGQRDEVRGKAIAALLIGATCIGVAPVLVRISQVGPSATAAFRVLLALPFLWIWLYREEKSHGGIRPRLSRKGFLLCGLAGLFFTGDLAFWHWSLKFTTVTNSTLLTNFAPFFVTAAAYFIFHEKIGWPLLVGLVIAFAGGALLASESLEISRTNLLGDFLALVTALFYAGYILTMKTVRANLSTVTTMTYSAMVCCPLLFVIAAISNETLLPATANGWVTLAALALISHVGGQCLIAYSLAHLPASFSSVTLLWQPVVAGLLAAIFLGEKLTSRVIIGGGIVLLGIALASGMLGGKAKAPEKA